MVATDAQRFPIRFTGVNRALWLLGILRRHSFVELADDRLRVRLGWGFRLDAPRASVHHVGPDDRPVRAWGAHGWRGRWLVNGSSQGIVRVAFDPPARATCLFLRSRVHELRVSVDDPDGLVAALARRPLPHVTN